MTTIAIKARTAADQIQWLLMLLASELLYFPRR